MKKMKTGQEENEDNLHFLHRVDTFQWKRGLKRKEACAEIRISEGQLSKIRNMQTRVNPTFWQRLEAAERAAGIAPSPEDPEGQPGGRLNEKAMGEELSEDRVERLERKIDRLEGMMEEMLRCIQDHKKI